MTNETTNPNCTLAYNHIVADYCASTPITPAVLSTALWLDNDDVDASETQCDELLDALEEVEGDLPPTVAEAAYILLQTYKHENHYEQPNCYQPGKGWCVV